MALSKAVTLLDWSRRKLRISVVMLMMPPTQECFVPLGQNHQWNFRTMLAVLRCESLGERAGSGRRPEVKEPPADWANPASYSLAVPCSDSLCSVHESINFDLAFELSVRPAQMMIGNPTIFAIESEITRAYERLGFRALGFFVLHVGGRRYGVYKPDATMLANSFDEVQERIAFCYKHTAPFAMEPDAGAIADAFRNAIYADEQQESFFGMPLAEFSKFFYMPSNVMWAPDGDEAFDDGSYVLQFDVESRVRLIAFKSDEGYSHDPNTLSDIWLPADGFYNILREWRDAFEAEWVSAPKSAENS
jgi:hypothetical protein